MSDTRPTVLSLLAGMSDAKPKLLAPQRPAELWGLWNPERGNWLPPIDEVGDPMLVCTSEEDAWACQQYQHDAYGIWTVPVRLL